MRLRLSRIRETRGSPIKTRSHQPLNHVTDDSNLDQKLEATPIGMGNTAFTARSVTTLKKNSKRESMKTNHAETNKDVSTDLTCMFPAMGIKVKEINRDSSRVFAHEPDYTPHTGSNHHSTINSQFMYNFHCNL
jgi:hypothetical protein